MVLKGVAEKTGGAEKTADPIRINGLILIRLQKIIKKNE
jgi:hypothetical protein